MPLTRTHRPLRSTTSNSPRSLPVFATAAGTGAGATWTGTNIDRRWSRPPAFATIESRTLLAHPASVPACIPRSCAYSAALCPLPRHRRSSSSHSARVRRARFFGPPLFAVSCMHDSLQPTPHPRTHALRKGLTAQRRAIVGEKVTGRRTKGQLAAEVEFSPPRRRGSPPQRPPNWRKLQPETGGQSQRANTNAKTPQQRDELTSLSRDHAAGHDNSRSTSSAVRLLEPDAVTKLSAPIPRSLRPANVSGFSCEAERSEVSSAASRCWAARTRWLARSATSTSRQRSSTPQRTRRRSPTRASQSDAGVESRPRKGPWRRQSSLSRGGMLARSRVPARHPTNHQSVQKLLLR